MKKGGDTNSPIINYKYNDRKVIKFVSNFTEYFFQTYGSRETLIYVLRESSAFLS